jgi:hypothetical protein
MATCGLTELNVGVEEPGNPPGHGVMTIVSAGWRLVQQTGQKVVRWM